MSQSTSAMAKTATFKRSNLSRSIRHQLTLPRLCAVTAMTAMSMSVPTSAQSFPAEIELSDLDGTNGFVINGNGYGKSGTSVSGAGDINGDGVDDLIIGSPYSNNGESYVVFGGSGVGVDGVIELSDIDGTNGFVLNGIEPTDYAGDSVSAAGDVNGDGVDDLIIGSFRGSALNQSYTGQSFVVFGGSGVGVSGVIELADLDGTNGFVLNGIDEFDQFGESVSGAGDINGDGVDDLIIGAEGAEGADANEFFDFGESYVVFGGIGIGVGGVIDLLALNGNNGFVLNGIDTSDRSGSAVSGAGDINDDGVDDLIIGADGADPNGVVSGESYVVFGGSGVGVGGVIELEDLDGSNGFVLNGVDFADFSGGSVSSAGDINADGVDDLIIGASGGSPNGRYSGQSFVVFGGSGVGVGGVIELSDLDGNDGFVLNGIDIDDRSGTSVSGAGDINGDGADDLIIGAPRAEPNGDYSGESYVVFGGSGIGAGGVFELSALNGGNGFVLNGVNVRDESGISVSGAGDINGDGLDDLIIGAPGADPNDGQDGESYVVFGRQADISSTDPVTTLTCNGLTVTVNLALGQSPTSGDDVIQGTEAADTIRALGGNDTICGLGGDDLINAGGGDDFVDAGPGNDRVFGLFGADVLRGRSGADQIFGGAGADLINGDGGADRLNGGSGADLIFGGGGSDGVFGQTGNDTLFGGDGNDSINGANGADEINGGSGLDTLNGGNGTDSCVIDSVDSLTNCE